MTDGKELKHLHETKTKRIIRLIAVVCIEITVFVILFNSLLPVPVSDAQSNAVATAIKPAVEAVADGRNYQSFTRKLAHVWEFTLLGAELGVLAVLRKKQLPARLGAALASGLFVGFLDETVQIFSSRGPKISDVWLDGLGVLLGLAAILAIYGIVSLIRRRKTARRRSEQ